MRFPAFTLAATALVLSCAASALAQPAGATRVLRTFDFEERRLGNAEDLPMHWVKAEGKNLPHYVNGRLTNADPARSGRYSFRFDLNGGGLVYRYEAGHLPVRPGAHYRVEGYCRTTALPHARARITAYFADAAGRPMVETVRHSDLYAARTDNEGWKRLGLELSADLPESASLVIELALLQPVHYLSTTLGERALFPQDIRGSAWFDDLSVSHVPQVSISTGRPGNVYRRNDRLRLRVVVHDRFIDDLAAQLVIRDARGQTVFQRSGPLDVAAAESAGLGRKALAVDLPPESLGPDVLPPGWYSATLGMTSGGKSLGEQTIDFIRLADDGGPARPDGRFGVIATDLPPEAWDDLPGLLPVLSAGRVKLALWGEAGDVQAVDPAAFDALMQRLTELGIQPTGCLIGLPPDLASKVGGPSWLDLLQARTSDWQPQLAYLISRHGARLDRWQLGADFSDDFVTRPEMREVYRRVYEEFSALVTDPDLAMPWPAWYELDGQLPATVALSVPPSVLPHQIPLYTQDLRPRGPAGSPAATTTPPSRPHNLSLSLQPLPLERYGREVQIRDFAQRMIYALVAGQSRIDVPLPVRVERRADGQVVQQPDELLMVLRTLTTTLSGATYQGRVPIAEGIDAFLFDRAGQGVLALWDRDAVGPGGQRPEPRELALNLGARPVSIDLWGNVTPLMRLPDDRRAGTVRLSVGPMPTFLVDIDGHLAQLRASVALDRPLVESSFQPHPRRVRFRNPYPNAISGTMKLRAPVGWSINPPTFNFFLNPGETFDRELTLEFPYNSYAGPKTVTAEFLVQGAGQGNEGDGNTHFTVPLTLTLGLSDVGMQTIAVRDGDDVVVQQMITNYGDRPIDYNAFAVFPGQARQERLVSGLAAGATTVKKYRFANVGVTGSVKVRVGVKEQEGTRILNDEVAIQ